MRYLPLALVLLAALPGAGQSHREEARTLLRKVQARYLEATAFESKLAIDYYRNHQTAAASETSEVHVVRKGERFYKRFMHTEEFRTEAVYVAADHRARTLAYGAAEERSMKALLGVDFSYHLDSASAITVAHDRGNATLAFAFTRGPVSKIVLRVDTVRYLITGQEIYYAVPFANVVYQSEELPRMHLRLLSFEEKEAVDDHWFRPEYLRETRGEALRDYIIINATN